MRGKIFLVSFGVTLAAALTWYAVVNLSAEIDAALTVVIWSLAAAAVGAVAVGLGLGVYFLATAAERHKQRRQDRQLGGVRFDIAEPGQQVYRSTVNERGEVITAPAHLTAGWLNGRAAPPNEVELRSWLAYQSLHSTVKRPALGSGMEAPTEAVHPIIEPLPNPVEIMRAMPHLWLVGKTRSGKTNAALWWLDLKQGNRFVIDPKPPGVNAWPGAVSAGHNGNEGEAVELFNHFMGQARARIDAGQLDGPPLVLLVDETYWVVSAMANATGQSARETWGELHRLSTICAEYGIFLGITSTAPQVASVGAEGLSGLLNNYSKFETVKRIESGRPVYGLYHYPSATDTHNRIEVEPLMIYQPSDPTGPRSFDPQAERAERARRMLAEGASKRQVCLTLIGGDGGKDYEALDRLLAA